MSLSGEVALPRWKADVFLLVAAAVWGSGFVAQRLAAAGLGAFVFNGLRFLLAGVLLTVLLRFRISMSRKELVWVIVSGTLLFGASGLQQLGLRTTTAANAGFITGLYVVLVPPLVMLIWRQRLEWTVWAALPLAAAGIFLLGVQDDMRFAPGDLFEMASAVVWALHVIWVGRTAARMDPLRFACGQFFVCGALSLATGGLFQGQTFANLPGLWMPVLYSAVFPIATGFTLQAVAQRSSPTTDAAIILSGEAVFAALFGALLLGERLGPRQIVGCVVIFAAILVAQWQPGKKRENAV
ncbi:MAG: DMT family transporter [Anaerolineaceae bacterium]